MDNIILTTMCAVVNDRGEWLFINRKKNWCGLALPGGKLEGAESLQECVKREIFEETGLTLNHLLFKGMTHFYNNQTKERYLVFNYVSYDYSGELNSTCDEGELFWIHPNEFQNYRFADGMEKRFDYFLKEASSEEFIEWNKENGYILQKSLLINI